MTQFERRDSIGEVLGTHLALFEHDMTEDPDDMLVMEKIRVISEAYRNFAVGDLAGFKEDFEHGYQRSKQDLLAGHEPVAEPETKPRLDFGES